MAKLTDVQRAANNVEKMLEGEADYSIVRFYHVIQSACICYGVGQKALISECNRRGV